MVRKHGDFKPETLSFLITLSYPSPPPLFPSAAALCSSLILQAADPTSTGGGGGSQQLSTGSDGEEQLSGIKTPDESSALFDGREAAAPPVSAPAAAASQLKEVDAVLSEEELSRQARQTYAGLNRQPVAALIIAFAPQVVVELRETETFWLLDMAGSAVAMDSTNAQTSQARNQAYEELLRKRTDMADM